MDVAVNLKNCADLWARLFDHRPFLDGEIKLFVKEFEESRRDREVIGLSEALKTVKNLNENQIPKASTKLDDLKRLNTLLEVSVQNCNTILEHESDYDVDVQLKTKREMRKVEWEKFMNDIESEYRKIDKTFKAKEEELKEFYADLERNLEIS